MLITKTYVQASEALRSWVQRLASEDGERGDVPGWVLVTVMTAGLVTVLWAVAGDKLQDMLESALDGVTGP
jgi:hypothetical protein